MAILITHRGGDWNQELYDRTMERVIPDPSNPPDGLIATYGGPSQTGGWKVTDLWESEAHWGRLRDETLIPVGQEIQAPPFDSDIGEPHNKTLTHPAPAEAAPGAPLGAAQEVGDAHRAGL